MLVLLSSCASNDSARYVQYRLIQANINKRAAEALDAGLIDAATAERILVISEAVSEQARKYRAALAEGRPRRVSTAILEVIARLLEQADRLLPPSGANR